MQTINQESIANFIIEKATALTKGKYENISADTHLATVGIDSLFAVLICGHLEDEYNIEVEPILMFQYKTANQVAEQVLILIEEQQ